MQKPLKKILLVPDSFKGTLSSREICRILRRVVRARLPDCDVVGIPVADGGEGTMDCFRAFSGGRWVEKTVHGPFGDPLRARYLRLPGGRRAVIELAEAAGLPLADGRRNPLTASTFGVGELMAAAVQDGCRELILGLGGSATNDAGAGLCAALGARFFGADGRPFVPAGGTLGRVASMDLAPLRHALAGCQVTAMCDVRSPLFGPKGAACVFAPQKGASPADVRLLDRALRQFGRLAEQTVGRPGLSQAPGAGAAGGAGFAVLALLGGRLRPGIEVVLDSVGFEEKLRGADLVFTGEGKLDGQSAQGKVVAGVSRRAAAQGVPVAALVGDIAAGAEKLYPLGLTAAFTINRRAVPLSEARRTARQDLAFTADAALRFFAAARQTGRRGAAGPAAEPCQNS